MEGERDESRGEEEAIGVTPRMESQVDPRVIGPLHSAPTPNANGDDARADGSDLAETRMRVAIQ